MYASETMLSDKVPNIRAHVSGSLGLERAQALGPCFSWQAIRMVNP
jgi:hypothetical protein